jgi:integrase
VRLTDISLRSLKPPAKGQRMYRDDTLAGFGVRVSQGGTKTFVLVHGADRQFTTIGRYGIVKLAKARDEARRILAERTLGKVRPRSITFAHALEVFLEEKKKSRRARTHHNLKARLNRHFPFKGQLIDVTHEDVAKRLSKIKTNAEHDHALSVAKTFFTWCHNRRYIDDNPTRGLSPHGHTSRARVLTDAELKAIWLACSSDSSAEEITNLPRAFAGIVQLLILLGQREGETAALHSSWIHKDTITLPGSITKNHREHTFPISSIAHKVLTAYLAEGLLFPARGKPDQPFNGWSKGKAALNELCGVTHWTLHDLRRTFRTNLGRLGVAPHIGERLVNHISARTDMEQVYDLHKYLPEMREAMNRWESHLRTILSGIPLPGEHGENSLSN